MRSREWAAEYAVAKTQFDALGLKVEKGPPEETLKKIRRASALAAAGLTEAEIAAKMTVAPGTVEHWRKTFVDAWRREYGRAMEAAVELVRSQIGTDAVLDDPTEFIRRARVAERWARKNDKPLFPASEAVTVSRFYETYYKPVRLAESPDSTRWGYEETIRLWQLFAGDPPIEKIDAQLLARFKAALQKMRGKAPTSRMAANTIRKHLRHLQGVLDKSGPPGFRNRDAAGIVPGPIPWVKPPKLEEHMPRTITLEALGQVYAATMAMEVPRLPGVKAPAWWRALIVVGYETTLRRGSLFRLRMTDIDWNKRLLVLPPSRMKMHRLHVVHLNDVAYNHLLSIRTDRELVFPWPFTMMTYHRHMRKLQLAAGLLPKERWGLQDLRRTACTLLFEDSPAAAQAALGHMSVSTTLRNYTNSTGMVARALDALPQPEAFTAVAFSGGTAR